MTSRARSLGPRMRPRAPTARMALRAMPETRKPSGRMAARHALGAPLARRV